MRLGSEDRSKSTVHWLSAAAKANWIIALSCLFFLPVYTSLVWPHYIIRGILGIGILAVAIVGASKRGRS